MTPALSEFLSTPWALEPSRLAFVASLLVRQQAGGSVATGRALDVKALFKSSQRDLSRGVSDGIVALPLYGVVTQRGGSGLDALFGTSLTSTQAFTKAFRGALGDDFVRSILIDIDSPGGSVYGVGELAAEIYAARDKKPIVAVANSLAASAAYWIGSSAGEFYVTPGGETGSIGVYSAHEDYSKHLDQLGVKTSVISAGKYKSEGNFFEPLSGDARKFMQSRVDDYYADFTKSVARGRGVSVGRVTSGMGQGRVLGADQALGEGMIDGVMTFDQVLAKLGRTAALGARPRLARAQLELEALAGSSSAPAADSKARKKASKAFEERQREIDRLI
jgi:signal peptide peptidase SppA